MARSKGIQSHPLFKLGKGPTKRDQRNLMFAAIMLAPKAVPKAYDFDLLHPGTPTPMFANDVYGDCVMAGRAHQTLRFELIEQKTKLKITDKEVLKEYMKETGGVDSGLIVLDSLKLWRSAGWKAAGKKLKIKAFAQLAPKQHPQMRTAIYMDVGVGLGLSLPISAQAQTQTGQPWDVTSGPDAKPGSWGGHYVYVPGYTSKGPVCVTWGKKQQMTWAFIDKYCDEAYAIFDATDTAKVKRGVDLAKLRAFLKMH